MGCGRAARGWRTFAFIAPASPTPATTKCATDISSISLSAGRFCLIPTATIALSLFRVLDLSRQVGLSGRLMRGSQSGQFRNLAKPSEMRGSAQNSHAQDKKLLNLWARSSPGRGMALWHPRSVTRQRLKILACIRYEKLLSEPSSLPRVQAPSRSCPPFEAPLRSDSALLRIRPLV